MFRRDVVNHIEQQVERLKVFVKACPPRHIIHICKVNLYFSAEGIEVFAILVFCVKLINIIHFKQIDLYPHGLIVSVDFVNSIVD